MAAKTSWHRYGTMEQNYVTVTLCIAYEETKNECKKIPQNLSDKIHGDHSRRPSNIQMPFGVVDGQRTV